MANQYTNIPPEFFFFRRVKKTESCWIWTGGKFPKTGYGDFGNYGSAHRFSYKFHKGEIPQGLCVLHKCDNRLCVNPEHLWVGTQKQNMDDMLTKGRKAIGEKHGTAVLNQKLVKEIRDSYVPNKVGGPSLARKYGVDHKTIYAVVKRLTWKHLV